MSIDCLVQNVDNALSVVPLPHIADHTGTVKVLRYDYSGWNDVSFTFGFELAKPIGVPDGTPVTLKVQDSEGKLIRIPGVLTDSDGTKIKVQTLKRLDGRCVAIETHGQAVEQAVSDQLKKSLQTEGLPNAGLAAETFSALDAEHLGKGAQESKLAAETAGMPVVFVSTPPDTTPAACVAAQMTKNYRDEGKTVLVVAHTNRELRQAMGQFVTADPVGSLAAAHDGSHTTDDEFRCGWRRPDAGNEERSNRVSELDSQIWDLVRQSPSAAAASALDALNTKRESLVQAYQAHKQQELGLAPIVFANIASALLCPAIRARSFDAVIIVSVHRSSVPEVMALCFEGIETVRVLADCLGLDDLHRASAHGAQQAG